MEALKTSCAIHTSGFSVGGVSVQLFGNCFDDVSLVESLLPFRGDENNSDIHLSVEWAGSFTPPRSRPLFDSGTTWRLYEDGAGFQFDFNAPAFGERPYKRLLADNLFRSCTLQMSEDSFRGSHYTPAPLDYPLDELLIMHRLTQEPAIELHGVGIVGPNGNNKLIRWSLRSREEHHRSPLDLTSRGGHPQRRSHHRSRRLGSRTLDPRILRRRR